jgi:hypothetical protein
MTPKMQGLRELTDSELDLVTEVSAAPGNDHCRLTPAGRQRASTLATPIPRRRQSPSRRLVSPASRI